MKKIVTNEPYSFNCDGEDLVKVLLYYGYDPDYSSDTCKIVCPFHEDVNPSLIVDIEQGKWFCFGCNLSGDALKFVSLLNPKLDDMKALRKYLKILKSNKVEKLDLSVKKMRPKQSSNELYDIAWDYYYGLSPINWKLDKQQEVKETKEYMLKRGFDANTLNKCKAKITYNKHYPIIFPMLDNNEFKGWVCRTTTKSIEEKRKYLYNKGFSRATTLVGDYENQEFVFVVEGYMDRLKFVQYGITNVVAILGWKMSGEQELKLKKSGVKYIISALDNDACGRKGTEYLKKIFPNKVYRFKYMKGIKDPGEMTKTQFAKMYNKTMQSINV